MPERNKEKDEFELEIARENRRFEISLFWQRANYFLVLNTVLLVGAYTVSSAFLTVFICAFGFFVSRLWFRTNIGAKFWQQFWEREVSEISIRLELKAMSESEETIRSRALNWSIGDENPWHKKYVHRKMITLKPEVSHNMILLSLVAVWAWFALGVFQIIYSIFQNFEAICEFVQNLFS